MITHIRVGPNSDNECVDNVMGVIIVYNKRCLCKWGNKNKRGRGVGLLWRKIIDGGVCNMIEFRFKSCGAMYEVMFASSFKCVRHVLKGVKEET